MLVEHFGSHFSQNGPFNLIPWTHCHIFNTLSIDTHIVYSYGHMAIWLYGHMAIIWPYGYTAIWRYGSECLVIWVSMERALKMWQCGQEIKLKGPFCEKWEPKCSVEHFGSHFSQNGPFNLISWPHCHIYNTLSINTHIVYSYGHMAIWLYGHMAIIWPYGYTAIWLYGSDCLVIWVSMERALKMWQCGQEIKCKGPFCEKWLISHRMVLCI